MSTTNIVKINRKLYKYEGYWRDNQHHLVYDYKGHPFPWPKPGKKWTLMDIFLKKLRETEQYLTRRNKFKQYIPEKYKSCLICHQKNITTGFYEANNFRWEDGLLHYIEKHHIKPSDEFIDLIFRYQINPHKISGRIKNITGKKLVRHGKVYLKIDRNQIMIMDALMRHGSSRMYLDKENKQLFRYSEHYGLLDFDEEGLERVIISGNTTRVDEGDEEIYLPHDLVDQDDFEYYFHTHPATPKPGGRAELGILYEFPSIGDLFHFIDHHNDGKAQGSIVITAEGMYIIRAIDDNKKIKINEDSFLKNAMTTQMKLQNEAIKKYGDEFTSEHFFSEIAQDTQYIEKFNEVLNKYELHIDFYPRVKDRKGRWIIDTVYLPVSVQEIE